MKIVATVRTLNEAQNIDRFCKSYSWADKILIADGGSKDGTKIHASKYKNVIIRDFQKTVEMKNGYRRNPHGEHLNFLIDWAADIGADWIIQDDCDCVPNAELINNARKILESTQMDFVFATRIYLWENIGYFPSMSKDNNGNWTPGLWAWRVSANFRFLENTPPQEHQRPAWMPEDSRVEKLLPPLALLHNPWQNEKMVERKLKYYRESGEVANMTHPLIANGKVDALLDWME